MSFADDFLMVINGRPFEKERGEQLTQALIDVTEERYARGYGTLEDKQQRLANITTNGTEISTFSMPDLSPSTGFGLGWEEGKKNVRDTIGGGISSVASTITGIIPWQLWLILGGIALFYLLPLITPFIARNR